MIIKCQSIVSFDLHMMFDLFEGLIDLDSEEHRITKLTVQSYSQK